MAQFTDCLIIGAGQAGLAMSHCLSDLGIDHVVLERGTIANRWTQSRWPSLRLLTPGWMTRLPGHTLASAHDGFLSATDLAGRLRDYGRDARLPIIERTDVLALEQLGERLRAVTSRGTIVAHSVVVATGACDRPRTPAWSSTLGTHVHQLASTDYRTPEALPEDGVLVVGASATGVQLAGEIAASGRRTMLAVGGHVRSPRRYRGRDLFEWLSDSGFLNDRAAISLSHGRAVSQPSLQLVGSDDNRDIDLYRLRDLGVELAGHAVGASERAVHFAGDLALSLNKGEERRRKLLGHIDAHIAQNGLNAPQDASAWIHPGAPDAVSGTVDLRAQGIGTVIWATGYRRDYSWLHVDACDERGELRQQGGICDVPGLYALGLPFMRHRASSFIDGVGRDAEAIAPVIAARLGHNRGLRAA